MEVVCADRDGDRSTASAGSVHFVPRSGSSPGSHADLFDGSRTCSTMPRPSPGRQQLRPDRKGWINAMLEQNRFRPVAVELGLLP